LKYCITASLHTWIIYSTQLQKFTRNLKSWSLSGHYSKKLTPRNNPVPKGGAIRINQNSQSAVSNKPRWRRPSAFGVGRTVTLTILQPSHFTILYIEAKGIYSSVLLILTLFVERRMCSHAQKEDPRTWGDDSAWDFQISVHCKLRFQSRLIYSNKLKELATRGHYNVSIINNTRAKKISGHLERTAYVGRKVFQVEEWVKEFKRRFLVPWSHYCFYNTLEQSR